MARARGALRVWRCEGCHAPLGEVGEDGRLRWYDDAVSVAAGSEEVRLIGCRRCGRVNPFRGRAAGAVDNPHHA